MGQVLHGSATTAGRMGMCCIEIECGSNATLERFERTARGYSRFRCCEFDGISYR
jgi:hypothetical protein